jgi:type II secretory pathway component PulF
VAGAVVLGLLTYVVPQVVNVFQNTNQTLPWLTRALIGLSDFLRASGWLWLIAIAVAVWAARRALRRPGPRLRFHRWLLRLPLVGPMVRGVNSAQLASTLGILVGSGAAAGGAAGRTGWPTRRCGKRWRKRRAAARGRAACSRSPLQGCSHRCWRT